MSFTLLPVLTLAYILDPCDLDLYPCDLDLSPFSCKLKLRQRVFPFLFVVTNEIYVIPGPLSLWCLHVSSPTSDPEKAVLGLSWSPEVLKSSCPVVQLSENKVPQSSASSSKAVKPKQLQLLLVWVGTNFLWPWEGQKVWYVFWQGQPLGVPKRWGGHWSYGHQLYLYTCSLWK